MSSRSDPTPPPAHNGGHPCNDPAAPCPVHCPPMEIEINNTSTRDDDYVQVKCDHPSARHRTPCRIRVRNAVSGSPRVVLTNPDGRLRFTGATDLTRSLSVAGNASWSAFQVSGETGSNALNDAEIQAHCQSAGGAVLAAKTLTVFWFDQARIRITTPGTYSFVGGSYTTTGGPAARFSAKARIRPNGVSCTAPQITNLRIGIMQESSNFRSTTTWGNPVVHWAGSAASGTRINAPTTITATTEYAATVAQPVADSEAHVAPLYDRPGRPGATLDANSLKRPIGCQAAGGTAEATSYDTPSHGAAATRSLEFRSGGRRVATVVYSRTGATRREHFRTFCVVFNTSTNAYCALREATWDLNVSSGGTSRATSTADGAATADPATGPNANTVSQPTVIARSGSRIFTKP